MFDLLPDPILRVVAYCKLEGLTNREIASGIDKSIPTVERKLKSIRDLWEREINQAEDSPD